jgi:protoporphyrinogen oxidase
MRDGSMTGSSETAILGAGPAGMACAMELHRAGRSFTLVEKSAAVGGLAKTYTFGAFRTDNGPHRFFSQNRYLYDFIEDLLGEEWIAVDRFTRFYVDGKFYRYPIQWRDALPKLGLRTAARAVLDYGIERSRPSRPAADFETFAVSNFGRTLAEFNLLPYTEKIWGLPCRELSADWAQQRIQGLTFKSLVFGRLSTAARPKTLVDQFYYPSLGTGRIYESILERIRPTHRVCLSDWPTRISHRDGRIEEIALASGEVLCPRSVVSSIPLTQLLSLLHPEPPAEVLWSAARLRFRSQVYLFLTFDKPSVSPDQWIYFPDPEVPFGRISEMRNFSPRMSPPGKTSLFVEFFCWEGDSVWSATKEALLEPTMEWLERLGLVDRSELIDVHHLRKPYVYPVYELGYERNLGVTKGYLDGFENLQYIGRPGRFRYTNQDHSLEMGILAARGLLDGKRRDMDGVGSDPAYFERGLATRPRLG